MNYNEIRRKSKKIKIGNLYIGGDAPIAIQSMTNTDSHDAKATLEQIKRAKEDLTKRMVYTFNKDMIKEFNKEQSEELDFEL